MTMKVDPSVKWEGPTRPYDLIKELVAAVVVIGLLAAGLAFLFSSPDEKAVTLKSWAQTNPVDFVQTATGELAGTTTSASYGPPYNNAGKGQHFGILKMQDWAGVRIPINPAQSFVIEPLTTYNDVAAQDAVKVWNAADPSAQTAWANGYADALSKAKDATSVADSNNSYGPVPTLVTSLLNMAKGGALDGALLTSDSTLPTNFTKPLLFLADSEGYFAAKAEEQHLGGEQWGVMNETGSWPGQTWLWLFSFWYQIDPFKSSDNADTIIMLLMGLCTLLLALVPVLPGIRKIPYKIPIHRLIWKDWYSKKL
jgi:hypothetical protein